MAFDEPKPESLRVGPRGFSTAMDLIRTATVAITPTTISATGTVLTATVSGVASTDLCVLMAAPVQSAIAAMPVYAQVSGTNQVSITYAGTTNTVPNAGNYTFLILRPSGGG